jgi:selenide,water dikinase
VLIDFRTSDDAGVYRWPGGPALVQTVDFFTPIVDDPFTYGQIAAANSLSDVYAMGGEPVTALAIAGFPQGELDTETIRQIFLGGFDKLREAGVSLLGGHTIRDPEVKFGYSVTGRIDPDRIWTNAGARAGDRLILTKPLGTGIVGTAIKGQRAPAPLVDAAVRSMTTLNKRAADVLRRFGGAVHGCTDITGFGLIGHATEIAVASGVTIAITTSRLPIFDGALAIAAENRSGGLGTNRLQFAPTTMSEGIAADVLDLCYDPQTSGGLLASVDAASMEAIVGELVAAGVAAHVIGSADTRGDGRRPAPHARLCPRACRPADRDPHTAPQPSRRRDAAPRSDPTGRLKRGAVGDQETLARDERGFATRIDERPAEDQARHECRGLRFERRVEILAVERRGRTRYRGLERAQVPHAGIAQVPDDALVEAEDLFDGEVADHFPRFLSSPARRSSTSSAAFGNRPTPARPEPHPGRM